MKDDFFIKIETWHKPDTGLLENVSLPCSVPTHDTEPCTHGEVVVPVPDRLHPGRLCSQ